MIVYAITSGEYSDYSVHFLMSDKKQAEEWIEIHPGRYDPYEIQEFELDPENALKSIKTKMPVWRVQIFKLDGRIYADLAYIDDKEGSIIVNDIGIIFCVRARHEKHAKKIAQDKYAQMKAEREGLT